MIGLHLEILVRGLDGMGLTEKSLVAWGWVCRDST